MTIFGTFALKANPAHFALFAPCRSRTLRTLTGRRSRRRGRRGTAPHREFCGTPGNQGKVSTSQSFSSDMFCSPYVVSLSILAQCGWPGF
ncbi:hypothetical protein F5883DRAFT_722652, partial [Diaporthe sp. PMI_573]